ncbi:MAG: plasmid mobilization relaxosome protein MobC [Eubacteriales bacterium]
MNRNKRVNFRLTEYELKSLNHRSRLAKMKVSDYCRSSILGKEIVVVDGLEELLHEMRKIGGNINQISYHLNCGMGLNGDLGHMKSDLNRITTQISRLLGGDRDGDPQDG